MVGKLLIVYGNIEFFYNNFTFIIYRAAQGWYTSTMVLFNTIFLIYILCAVHKSDSDEPIQFVSN